MWVEKHRPRNVAAMVGNEESRMGFYNWLGRWKRGDRPALLVGPPGTGKSTLAHVVARDLGYLVIELNASDVRTKESLRKKLGPLLTSSSLPGEKLLVFLDEVDGMYGRSDYGGMEFVGEMIDGAPFPLALAANLEGDQKVAKLAAKCLTFRFRRIPPRLVELYLKSLIEREGVRVEPKELKGVVEAAGGDIRAAVNSLQGIGGLPPESASQLITRRDTELSLTEALNRFFAASDREEALRALRSSDSLPSEKVWRLYTSLVASGLPISELVPALEEISKSDELAGEIARTQKWRLLRHADRLMALSLFDKIRGRNVKYSEGETNWNLMRRIWNDSRPLKAFSKIISAPLHSAGRRVSAEELPYILLILSKADGGRALARIRFTLNLEEAVANAVDREAGRILKAVKLQ